MIMNRRHFPRMPAIVDVDCRQVATGGDLSLRASTRDISEGGVGMVLTHRHAIGTLLDLKFRLPGSTERVSTKGRIAWVAEFTVGPDKAFDTGIEFVDLEPDAREGISSLIATRPSPVCVA